MTPRIPPAAAPATAGRALQLARAGYAGALLRQPGGAIRVATGRVPGRCAGQVARLLGARHLAQATLTTLAPLPAVFMVGAGVDALHAASMVILAAVDRTARRAALADAAVEAAFAATGLAVAVASGGLPDRRPGARTYRRSDNSAPGTSPPRRSGKLAARTVLPPTTKAAPPPRGSPPCTRAASPPAPVT